MICAINVFEAGIKFEAIIMSYTKAGVRSETVP
jgi:hypothetical protein